MKRSWWWGGAAALAAAGVAAASLSGGKGIPVQVVKVRRGRVEETVTATKAGTLKAKVRVMLGAQTAGRVQELRHRDRERVAKGEPICLLEASELDARLAQAQDALAESERQERHQKELLERKVVPQESLDQARTKVALDRAALDLARSQRDKAVLAAPFDGVIADTFVEAGQWVVPGTSVCEFLDDSEYHVEADVDEIDSAHLKAGQPVHLSVDALPGERFEGLLSSISPAVSTEQEKNRTVRVKVAWPGDRSRVRPGMSVGVEVVVGLLPEALYVPSPAVMDHAGRRSVWTVEAGRLREKEIEVGLGNWETTAVTKGLAKDEPVVLSLGSPDLKEGTRVVPTEAP